jgi:hypothetical protein
MNRRLFCTMVPQVRARSLDANLGNVLGIPPILIQSEIMSRQSNAGKDLPFWPPVCHSS